MATAAVSSSSLYQQLQSYFQQRSSDLQQLGQALESGDLTSAQQEYQAIQSLGQSGPFANGDPFRMSQREQDFEAIGQALQSGDLTAAQEAFAQLESTFHRTESSSETAANPSEATSPVPSSASQPVSGTTSTSDVGPEVIVNLGTVSPGEEITIGLSPNSDGSEQVTIGVANQQGQTPEQITLNLNPNSNEQIVLNLLNGASNASSENSGLNVTA